MADLLGATLTLPGQVWDPPQGRQVVASVVQYTRPSRYYSEGRLRLTSKDGSEHWLDIAKLQREWVTSQPQPDASRVTPRRTTRSTAAVTPSTTGPTTRSRRLSARADGYDSAAGRSDGEGAAVAAAAASGPASGRRSLKSALVSPGPVELEAYGGTTAADPGSAAGFTSGEEAAPGTAMRRRGRPRKSLRFTEDTYSPGGAAAAAAAAAANDPAVSATGGDTAAYAAAAGAGVDLASPPFPPRASDPGAAARAAAGAPEPLTWEQNARNAALMLIVTLPALYFYSFLRGVCSDAQRAASPCGVWAARGPVGALTGADWWCALGGRAPVAAVNALFFLNVDVLFWLVGLLQGSFWLIDPFWTIIPVLIGLFYAGHPAAVANPLRSKLSLGLLLVWAVRLTHSYFRREEWQFGAREDWRYERMAAQLGPRAWAFVSFWTVGVAQHAMLVGVTLPLAAIHASPAPWRPLVDGAITLAAAAGICIALTADNQLHEFMAANRAAVEAGRPPRLLLNTGLWRYSRHPNYFGEQLWWWSLAAWAVLCGQPWMVVGATFNSLCMLHVTRLTEGRMLERPERAAAYRRYQAATSMWLPLPPRAGSAEERQQ